MLNNKTVKFKFIGKQRGALGIVYKINYEVL